MLTQLLMSIHQGGLSGGATESSFIYAGEMTKIMLIPIAVQCAFILSGLRFGGGDRAVRGRRGLVETFEAGKL
jgi:hypothetical protein